MKNKSLSTGIELLALWISAPFSTTTPMHAKFCSEILTNIEIFQKICSKRSKQMFFVFHGAFWNFLNRGSRFFFTFFLLFLTVILLTLDLNGSQKIFVWLCSHVESPLQIFKVLWMFLEFSRSSKICKGSLTWVHSVQVIFRSPSSKYGEKVEYLWEEANYGLVWLVRNFWRTSYTFSFPGHRTVTCESMRWPLAFLSAQI